jgi:membrane protease YdiL (CAAX protease family)
MKSFIKKYPNAAYYFLVFGWTWILAFWLLLSGSADDVAQLTPVFMIVGVISNISPSISAFIVTRISKGKRGVQELKDRFKVKSSFKWYAVTLLIVPTVEVATTAMSHLTIRTYEVSIVIPAIIAGLIWPLFSGFGEEFGWRGYILPQLLSKYSPIKSALILGFIWEVWHLPMHYMAYRGYGAYMVPAFVVIGFINLTLHTIIMTYIFIKNKGSIKLMVLYHYTITGSSILVSGFLRAEVLPRYTVLEGIVSVCIFAVITAFIYLRQGKGLNVEKRYIRAIGEQN